MGEPSFQLACFPDDPDHLSKLFQKKRQLRFREDEFRLPLPSTFYQEEKWEVSELLTLKKLLNETKERLDNLEMISWHTHTRAVNNARRILPNLKQTANPEFCSWAWAKFTECLNSYPVIPKVAVDLYRENLLPELNSVHICEAPGAFVSATNHFLVQNMPCVNWNWVATTLNPYFEGNDVIHMINEDRLILGSWENWTFLKDGTGNILVQDNIRNFIDVEIPNHRNILTHIHLVTADGSIDCQHNPGEQEALVEHLHLAEIVTALNILGEGGSFVVKIFTFFECTTVCHLYLLACTFRELHLFKPVTSKEGNSEVYVICNGFLGRDKFRDELELILSNIEDVEKCTAKALFPLSSVDPEFMRRILSAATFFANTQISIIERNLNTFPPAKGLYGPMEPRQVAVWEKYYELFPVKRLRESDTLFHCNSPIRRKGGAHTLSLSSEHIDPRVANEATLSGRRARLCEEFHTRLELIRKSLGSYKVGEGELHVEINKYTGGLGVCHGKPYENILSSRFCFSRLLLYRQELRDLLKSYQRNLTFRIKPLVRNHICTQQENAISIHSTLSKLTGIDIKTVEAKTKMVCFHEFGKTFILRSDMDVTEKRLVTLLDTLGTLEKFESIFLCEFPLLARLHVGLIFLLTKMFSKVLILVDKKSRFHGILLTEFHGFGPKSPLTREAVCALKQKLKTGRKFDGKSLLELVDIRELCSSPHWDSISAYNTSNVLHAMDELIAEATRSFCSEFSYGPIMKKRRIPSAGAKELQ